MVMAGNGQKIISCRISSWSLFSSNTASTQKRKWKRHWKQVCCCITVLIPLSHLYILPLL